MVCFTIEKTKFWSHTIFTYPEHQKNWNIVHTETGSKLIYPKLFIVIRIKICNYNKIPNNWDEWKYFFHKEENYLLRIF
jgi:hypothetical protein